MKLYKIINAVIPTMYNSPCRIAIFTDGKRCKVFQKDYGNWKRNVCLEIYKTPSRIEQQVNKINECGQKIKEINEYAKRGTNR